MRSFVKIKSSRIGEITLLFNDIGKSRPCREFFTSQICVLTLLTKIKLSRRFPNLQDTENTFFKGFPLEAKNAPKN